ncbi:hypothetical protein GQ600_25189 [Phytophthora cactorum]|nr:hypothetical protein GQ600_25189 [Phytophthora cactorum]
MENQQVTQLREQLRRLEQENDDLQSSVRRLEAMEKDLKHKLDRAEEELIFAQQEMQQSADQVCNLAAKLEAYENVMDRLLTAAGIPAVKKNKTEHDVDTDQAALVVHGDAMKEATTTQEAEKLRAELKAKSEKLQTIEDNYEELMVASYEVERAFVSENEELKRLIEKMQANLQTKRYN